MKRLLMALAVAALIFTTAGFKGCAPGDHAGLPVGTKTDWIEQYTDKFIVFGRTKPVGVWTQVGWLRRPPGSRMPRVRVWVQGIDAGGEGKGGPAR